MKKLEFEYRKKVEIISIFCIFEPSESLHKQQNQWRFTSETVYKQEKLSIKTLMKENKLVSIEKNEIDYRQKITF